MKNPIQSPVAGEVTANPMKGLQPGWIEYTLMFSYAFLIAGRTINRYFFSPPLTAQQVRDRTNGIIIEGVDEIFLAFALLPLVFWVLTVPIRYMLASER